MDAQERPGPLYERLVARGVVLVPVVGERDVEPNSKANLRESREAHQPANENEDTCERLCQLHTLGVGRVVPPHLSRGSPDWQGLLARRHQAAELPG